MLILDDATPVNQGDPSSITVGQYNRAIFDDFLTACHAVGMLGGGWTTEGGSLWLVPSYADLAIAEIEGPGDFDGVRMLIEGTGAGPLPTCPLGTVTNFSTLDSSDVALLLDAGFTFLPEAYANENPNQTPASMDRLARSLGCPSSQPVAGVYPDPDTGNPPPVYPEAETWPLADYLGEYVI